MFQFTFKCGYNDFISKYTDINSLHVTQIDLLHNDTFAVLNSLVSDVRIFACKLSDDFSGFVNTCGTGKRNRVGVLVLGNGSIVIHVILLYRLDFVNNYFVYLKTKPAALFYGVNYCTGLLLTLYIRTS